MAAALMVAMIAGTSDDHMRCFVQPQELGKTEIQT
jgi:hypothetical protein